jgi:hypothetical protein
LYQAPTQKIGAWHKRLYNSLTNDTVFELALVLRAVDMAFRFTDEAVVVDLPKFAVADSNAFSVLADDARVAITTPHNGEIFHARLLV